MGNIVSSNKNQEVISRCDSHPDEMICGKQQNLQNNQEKQEQRKVIGKSTEELYFNEDKSGVKLKVEKELPTKQFDDFIKKINIENNATSFEFEAYINFKKHSTDEKKDVFKVRCIPLLTSIISQRYYQIKELKLSFPSQSECNMDVDIEPIISICTMLNQLPQLESLSLNLFQWGYYNSNIKSDSVTLLCNTVTKLAPNLKTLELDLGRWGCEKYGNLKIYNDETISHICEMVKQLQQLRVLDLNLRSWGYENYKITNQSVIQIFQSVGTLKNLVNLKVNLTKWGYLNNNISENSLQDLKTYLEPLQNLKQIYLNFDLWTHLHNYKYIKEALVQLPLLEQCNIDTTEEQSEVKKLCELIKYRQKNYLMAYSAIQSNQKDFYRREIIWDALRVCMQEQNKQ